MRGRNVNFCSVALAIVSLAIPSACSGQSGGASANLNSDEAFVSSEPSMGMTERDFNASYLTDFKASLDQTNLEAVNRLETKSGSAKSSIEDVSRASTAVYIHGPKKLIYYNLKIGRGMQISSVFGIVGDSLYRVVCPDYEVDRQTVIQGACKKRIVETFGFSLNPAAS